MLYHASSEAGLRLLEPHISTHGKAYVYAINNKITALCFGAPKDDFDLLIDEIEGVTHLYECYPNALEKIYGKKICSLYEVDEEGFLCGKTGWDAELVCEDTVPVLQEERISDIYMYLVSAARRGECVIHSYSDNQEYQSMLRDELGERIKDFGLSAEAVKQDARIKAIFKDVLS